MTRRLVVITAAIAVALAGGAAVAFATSVDEWLLERATDPASKPPDTPQREAPTDGKPESTFTRSEAKEFQAFELYNLGEAWNGLPLVALLYEKGPPIAEAPASHNVTFVYGDCEARSDQSCAPPLAVANEPACRRNPAVLDIPADEKVTTRGVPAWFYDEWIRLEVLTGRVAVVFHLAGGMPPRDRRAFLLDAAAELRGVNHLWPSDGPLPEPAEGAAVGTLSCAPGE